MYETISFAAAEQILTLTLNRPDKLNAFTAVMADELIDALDRADADDEIRAIIVTGAGRAFCAGADLSAGPAGFLATAAAARHSGAPPSAVRVGMRDAGGRLALRIFSCLKPVIAAVNGPAVGVGITMQLPMDIRVASQDARFGFVFTRRGIVPEACSSWFLPRLVGISTALEWTLSGRLFDAREALERGLISKVVPADQLMATARALAREIAQNTASVSVALTRQLLWRMLAAAHPLQAHEIDSRAILSRAASQDAKEGVAAFLQKRAPQFTDRVSQLDLLALFADQ